MTIFGTDYALKADTSHDYINETAAYLDKKMREIAAKHQDQSDARIAVLAGLNITDELFRSRDRIPDNLEAKIVKLAETLKAAITD